MNLKMKRKLLTAILLLVASSTFAQLSQHYRSADNPLYWKNRKPDAAYWQQDVHYKINARIDEKKHTVKAEQKLEYWNNSPDTLHYVYFHMWQNAFIKGSYLHQLEEAQMQKAYLGKYERNGLGIVVEHLEADGKEARLELDNTILKVYLPEPLYPNSSVTFDIDFTTYYDNGSTRRRMKMYPAWGHMHYNGVQWFPKICVYDRKMGWDTYQHLNKEFYADFGTYEVSLDFPSNYVVEATGALKNREEVLPKDLREKLDVKNFKDKPWNEPPSVITPYKKDERKVWKFEASNVHDFAFTADPSYRIATAYWNGVECVGICQEPHASRWQNSAEYVAKIIQTFSEDIGMYEYPKMVAADARDGMEYPMLTLDGGGDPGYRGLLIHEIGHNWFYGMVGNNETYRAALDEGFTQFLTAWGYRKLEGDTMVGSVPKSKFKRKFVDPQLVLDRRVMNSYLYTALNQNELPLNTHSNDFNDALGHGGGYGMVYYKTATMLYNLQYVLGDSLFLATMQNYFDRWRFAHPYFDDFRTSVIDYTNVDLTWFFDQWLETTKRIDYGVNSIKKAKGDGNYTITFERKGQMQMPIDFTVTAKDGKRYSYHIPNTWFVKETDAIVLPKWYGWGKIKSTYDADVVVPSGIKNVEIDTTKRLADVYSLDNVKSHMLPFSPKALKVSGDIGLSPSWDRHHNRAYVRPDVWWNGVDGAKVGLHLESDYMFTMHKVDASVWFNTHLLQLEDYYSTTNEGMYDRYVPINYKVSYTSPINRNMPKLKIQLNSRLLDGLWQHGGGLLWEVNGNNTLYGNVKTMWRSVNYDLDYLLYPSEWSSMRGRPNSSINLGWLHNYNYVKGSGSFGLSFRAPFFTGNSANAFDYSYAQLEAINYNWVHKLMVKTRLFARYGTGANVPYESMLWLSGANPEDMMDNKYTRSIGIVPNDWTGFSQNSMNHFQQGGGMNLRGYAGYLVADERNGEVLIGYKGRSGLSGNIEVDFDQYIRMRPKFTRNWLKLDLYAFADAGVIELSRVNDLNNYWNVTPTTMWSDLRVDAGLGMAVTIKKWWWMQKAKPLTLRFDVPMYVNRPPYAEPDYFKFRYVIGVNRAF